MKNEWLFVTRNEYKITNIPDSYIPARLQMLKTRYMTLTAVNNNNEPTGLYIQLRKINLCECTASFEVVLEGHVSTLFTIGIDDDPIIRFMDDEPGIEHHVFENVCDYEINKNIKPNTLYKLQKEGSDNFRLVIVTDVTPYTMNFNEVKFSNNTKCTIMSYEINSTHKCDIDVYEDYIISEIGSFDSINKN